MTDERCTHDRYDKEYAAASGRCAVCLVKELERLRKPPIAGCCGGEVILRPCSIKHEPHCVLLKEKP